MRPRCLRRFFASASYAQGIGLPEADVLETQLQDAAANVPGSIFALQPFRNAQVLVDADGTEYRLTSLNPRVNSWYVLEITPQNGRSVFAHFENADRATWTVSLIEEDGPALLIEGDGDSFACAPWSDGELDEARATGLPYAPICDWTTVRAQPRLGQPHHAGGGGRVLA